MKCNEIESLLERYLDSELTLSDRREFEAHIGSCKTCEYSLHQYEALKKGFSSLSYEKAPSTLRKNIRRDLRDISNEESPSASPFQWLSFSGGLMFFVAISTWIVTQFIYAPMNSSDFGSHIANAHIRSLQVNHLLDVVSTDKHTVKPWFVGKLDFAPVVKDLQAKGYKLSGGRMDYVNDKLSAALVYKRRSHLINVFLFNNNRNKNSPNDDFMQKKGFNLVTGNSQGLDYWIISDLNLKELKTFAKLYFGADSAN